MIAEALVKAAAVGSIVMIWTKFTLETFKICKQIVYPNKKLCDECCEEKEHLCDEFHERHLDN